jgi:hypothetical protein
MSILFIFSGAHATISLIDPRESRVIFSQNLHFQGTYNDRQKAVRRSGQITCESKTDDEFFICVWITKEAPIQSNPMVNPWTIMLPTELTAMPKSPDE